ncbi:RCC1/BLIP-II [Bimuria novae-zelandiae CBS 107.79]|uniref:RCC1/BLIP-II n=1 Tax=Bimuria novae-zelandiae CBS 107.79 TaxID=1447943 RepID=A0A6A5VEI0_9PLEO|nr:RCC1/BLIP-II [Bimuria novae-zelandiae CBS 107.79]
MPYRLYVFGSNGEGQLGIEAAEIVSIPTIAHSWPPNKDIKVVCGGDNHTLILSSDGSVHYAGNAEKNQFGSTKAGCTKYEGFEVSHRTDVIHCAATCESSSYICGAFESDHEKPTILIEGTGHWGETGSVVAGFRPKEPIKHPLPHSVVDFAAGGWHYVGILSDGSVIGWGKSRLDQLGTKFAAQQRITVPTLIQEDIAFKPVKVVCGKEFTYLASDPSSSEHCLLGRDKFGLRSSMPGHIKGWKQIGATWNSIFVLFGDGSLTAWGKGNMWKLLPDNLPLIERIAVGSEHILALTRERKLISWGWGKHGNCGDLTKLGDKVKNDMVSGFWNEIDIPGTIKHIAAGYCTSFVLTEVSEQKRA